MWVQAGLLFSALAEDGKYGAVLAAALGEAMGGGAVEGFERHIAGRTEACSKETPMLAVESLCDIAGSRPGPRDL